ncbi:MAG TPA: autotransporter outer membrane beta-barrel domain-containing protein, partial [Oleiagrimonas sp.]|nr:autotransporter outer membrane beta-barrel domain-containing protein [Oleiagrimonas sp.]
NASLAGTMHVLGAPDGYTVKSNENLLTAGKLSGTFDTLTLASSVFYTGTLAYTGTQVNVSLAQANVASAAAGGGLLPLATSETRLAASHVQSALDVSNRWFTQSGANGHEAWFADAGRFLSASNPALATMSLNSLSGEIYATSRAVEAAQSLAADATIAHREHDLAYTMTPGVWVQALGADGALARKGYESANYRASGAMIGMDGRFNATWSAGIALGRTHSNASMTALGGDLDGRENVAAIYARWDAPHGWYAAARTSYASIRNNVHRHVLLGTTLTSLTGNRTDHVTLGAVESGKTMARGAASLTPYVSITDLHLAQGSFAERSSTMGLAAPAQTHDALLGTLGLRYRWSFNWAPGHSSLTGRLAFRHAISGANLAVKASFNGVPDSTFLAQGQNLPRDLGIIGAELVTQVDTHWSWYVDADYQAGSAGTHQIGADAGVRLGF